MNYPFKKLYTVTIQKKGFFLLQTFGSTTYRMANSIYPEEVVTTVILFWKKKISTNLISGIE